jgi:hypothetical protein
MHIRPLILPLLFLAAATACRDKPDMDFGGRDIGPDLFAIESTDGNVRMALTDDYLYLALAEQAVEEAREGMRSARDRDGAAALVAGFVERTVGKALQFRALYPLDEIEDIRWEDGELRIDFRERRRSLDEVFQMGDEPVTRAFSEEAVLELSDEFHALQRERTARGR